MIVYSVTVSVEKKIENEWLNWMKTKHIPDVIATGYFSGHHLHLLREPVVDPESSTYNVLYYLDSAEKLNEYNRLHSAKLQKEHEEKFRGRFVAFRTVLERI